MRISEKNVRNFIDVLNKNCTVSSVANHESSRVGRVRAAGGALEQRQIIRGGCGLAAEMAFVVPPRKEPSTLNKTSSTSFNNRHFLVLG